MKKITGKVVSLVLALALVVSSFSANFAFASKRTVSGTVDFDGEDTVYLVNGDTSRKLVGLKDWIKPDIESKDHEDANDEAEIKAISHVSGDSLVKWDIDDGDADLQLRKNDKDGKEVISVLLEGKYDDDDDEITVKARKELTVYVLEEDSLIIGKADESFDAGKECEEPDTFAVNEGSKVKMSAYKVVANAGDEDELLAKYEKAPVTNVDDDAKTDKIEAEYASATFGGLTVKSAEKKAATTSIKVEKAADDAAEVSFLKEADGSITISAGKNNFTADAILAAYDESASDDVKALITVEKTSEVAVEEGSKNLAGGNAGSAGGEKVEFGTFAQVSLSSDDNVQFVEDPALKDSTNGTTDFEIVSGRDSNSERKDAKTSNVTVYAKKINSDKEVSTKSDDKYSFKTKVEKKIDVATYLAENTEYTTNHKVTIDKDGSDVEINGMDRINARDHVLDFGDNAQLDVVVEKGSLKEITGTLKSLTIKEDGDVDTVDITGPVTVDDGKVNEIKEDATTVEVNGGKVGNVEADSMIVKDGNVGNMDIEGNVTIEANDEEEPVSIGKIESKGVKATAEDDAKINITSIKVKEDSNEITLIGNNVNVNSMDLDYREATVNFGDDDDEYIGTIAAPQNADNAKLIADAEDTDVTVKGAVKAEEIEINSDAKMSFDSNVTVDTLGGDGEMKINAGKLYVKEGASGTVLKLADKTLAPGQTVFKSDKDNVDEDDLDCFGFTLEKASGNDIDTFKIKSLEFAGVAINKDSSKIAKGYSETFTASAYPTGTALPEGATVKWELDGGSYDVFKLTTEGNTAKVEVVAIDDVFESENTTTLKATLYDEDGYEMDDYDAAKCEIKALKVPEAVSDTTSNFALAQGSSYQFKITSATQPNFAVGTAGVFNSELVAKNGNDYFYKITATGKPGQEAGIYLNGEKLLVASVKAPAFKCDTTMKTTVKGSYTVKVTADKTPSFAVGTAGVFKAEFVSNKGNDYFYKITSTGKKGAEAGIYVNGVKAFVAVVG